MPPRVRLAVQDAVSIAALLITTEIADKPEPRHLPPLTVVVIQWAVWEEWAVWACLHGRYGYAKGRYGHARDDVTYQM